MVKVRRRLGLLPRLEAFTGEKDG